MNVSYYQYFYLFPILSLDPQLKSCDGYHDTGVHRPEQTSYRSLILPTKVLHPLEPPPTWNLPCSTGSCNPLVSPPLLRTLLTLGLSSQTVFEGQSWRVLVLN